MASPKAFRDQNYQEPYVRSRDNPYFKGLLQSTRTLTIDHRRSNKSQKISRSHSDVTEYSRHDKISPPTSKNFEDSLLEDFATNIATSESPEQCSELERAQKVATTTSDNSTRHLISSSATPTGEDCRNLFGSSTMEKKFIVNKRKADLSEIPLPQSAATFYSGLSPQLEVVELCESTKMLNQYLKARKDEVNVGVPGKFLQAVISQDIADVGCVASTIMYAFYLNETQSTDQFCTVPVINIKRVDLSSHAELKWLLDSCQIDQSLLIFIDEVDLSYYDIFGGLKLVLLNAHKLPYKQEALKESVTAILTCRLKSETAYPWVETVTETEDCSCCTFIAEKLALTSPEILIGKAFSRLLLAGILSDSGNLTNSYCSSKDKYIATLLIHSAGRLGCNGLYQTLRYKRHDISDLTVIDILRKDFKTWTRVGKPDNLVSRLMMSNIGMSSIGISLAQLLTHKGTATQEIKYFQQLEKLRLLVIVSGYYDSRNNFKREILVSAESAELMKNLLAFFKSNMSHLPLKVLQQPDLREDMRAFEIDKVTSRKTIERLLEEFGGSSKG